VATTFDHELYKKYTLYKVRHSNKMNAHNKGSAYHMKDSEQNKTYQAEWELEKLYPQFFEKLTKRETEAYVKRITQSKFWCGNNIPRVEWMKDMGTKRRQDANATKHRIRFSPSGASKYIILHELAHVAGYMNHGRGFRIFLLKIVSRFLGREVSKSLKNLFRDKGLKISKIREPLDYETWKKRYDGLSESRARFGGGVDKAAAAANLSA